MKKTATIFTLLFALISISVSAQTQLVLTNIANGKVKSFVVGKTIHIKGLEDTDFEKVKIQKITDKTIVFYLPNADEESPVRELALTEIQSIKKSTPIHSITKGIGAFFMLGGAYTMASSNALAGDDGSTGAYIGLGAGMFAAGLVPYLFKPRVYILGKTHTAEIK